MMGEQTRLDPPAVESVTGQIRVSAIGAGELALMRAVLEDAIDCYLGRARRRRIHARILEREAEYWIRIEDWEAPFSFNNVCEALGLDPTWTRQALTRLKFDRHARRQARRLRVAG